MVLLLGARCRPWTHTGLQRARPSLLADPDRAGPTEELGEGSYLFPPAQPEPCLYKAGVRVGVFLPRNRSFLKPSGLTTS